MFVNATDFIGIFHSNSQPSKIIATDTRSGLGVSGQIVILCKNSTFASNYRYLSCKYSLSHHDWHLDMNHQAGKVRLKNKQKSIYSKSCQDIIELCEIRDGLSSCDTLSNDDICKIIDIICIE